VSLHSLSSAYYLTIWHLQKPKKVDCFIQAKVVTAGWLRASNGEPKPKRLHSAEPDLGVFIGAKKKEYRHHSQIMASFSSFIDTMLATPMRESQSLQISFPVLTDNFRMNTSYGRYSAAYNMVGFSCFNEELSLLPKNPTEAKLQATSTRGESTEPTKGVMKHTYKVVLYNYCLMQYCCILFYQLVSREGCNPNQRGKVSKSMNSSSTGNR
jgi:hypothetical protein